MAEANDKEHEQEPEPESPDVHFEPIVKLALVENKTLEEEEDILLTLRSRLYRYDHEAEPVEWKERGTGDCKILKHKVTGYIRILMRREKTLKICANHYIYPTMELKPNCGSDRAWVWTTQADFADEESKEEVLAIRFANAENAQKFKTVFDESAIEMKKLLSEKKNGDLAKADDKAGEKTEESIKEKTEESSSTSIASKQDNETNGLTEKLEDLKVSGDSKAETEK